MSAAGTIRVIAGSLKGRRLKAPAWSGLRPTSDKLRETLFNVVAPRVVGARVLDAFAGTGALGIEALSRGAARVTFVERDPRALSLIEENLARCGVTDGYVIIRASVDEMLETLRQREAADRFDLVLLDPPYEAEPSGALNGVGAFVSGDGLVVLEHARKRRAPATAGRLVRTRELIAGDSALTFYACQP